MVYDAQPTPPLLSAEDFIAGTNGRILPGDARVQPLLDGATVAIRKMCGWHISPEQTETGVLLDADGGDLLVLPTLRLVAVEELSLIQRPYTSPLSWQDLTAEELDALEWSENGEVRHRCWPRRFRSVRITYRHGFSSVPDLVQVIQQVVANALASPMGATSEAAGALSVSWAKTAPGVSGGLSLLDRDLQVVRRYALP